MAEPWGKALGRAVMVVDRQVHEELQAGLEVGGNAHRGAPAEVTGQSIPEQKPKVNRAHAAQVRS